MIDELSPESIKRRYEVHVLNNPNSAFKSSLCDSGDFFVSESLRLNYVHMKMKEAEVVVEDYLYCFGFTKYGLGITLPAPDSIVYLD